MISMTNHPTQQQLMESSLATIRILRAQPGTDQAVFQTGGINTVLVGMHQHMRAPKLVQEGAGLLGSFAVTKEYHAHIVQGNAVKIVLSCMFQHPSNPEVQLNCLVVLRCLSIHPEVQV